MTKQLSLIGDEFTQDIHKHFAWMRENAPVYQAKLMLGQKAYVITRYEDVVAAMKDPRIIKNASNAKSKSGKSADQWMPKFMQALQNNMLNTDEPDHRRLRNLVHKAFTPRMIAQLESRIGNIVHGLIDKHAGKREMEFMRDFALPIPVTVIAEMVGIPEADRPKFFSWTEKFISALSPLGMMRVVVSARSLDKYIRQLARERKADPRNDLMTALVQAEDEGDSFTEDELVSMIVLLTLAGYETTVSLIGNGMLSLLQHPEQYAMLKADHSLLPTAIEEFVRYEGPISTTEFAYAREDITLHGVTIPRGSIVLPAIASANRDEAFFENANTFDITRSPNKHLGFGHGIHYCLGAPLARLEAKKAFCAIMERMPDLHLTIDESKLRYKKAPLVHRLEKMPVAW